MQTESIAIVIDLKCINCGTVNSYLEKGGNTWSILNIFWVGNNKIPYDRQAKPRSP